MFRFEDSDSLSIFRVFESKGKDALIGHTMYHLPTISPIL